MAPFLIPKRLLHGRSPVSNNGGLLACMPTWVADTTATCYRKSRCGGSMKKASLYGLSFRTDVDLDGNELKAPITDSYREFAYGAYSLISRRYYRPIGEPPTPAQNGTNSNVNQTIDASVFTRWNADTTYRPQNLV